MLLLLKMNDGGELLLFVDSGWPAALLTVLHPFVAPRAQHVAMPMNRQRLPPAVKNLLDCQEKVEKLQRWQHVAGLYVTQS